MSDVEKLFVKLHDRNKSILDQVKQRTESYCQHLASKLLIAGFTPPSWLLDPDSASGSEELNKEDLISKLIRPYPQLSTSCSVAHYPGYGKLVSNGDNEEFMENPPFNKNLDRKNDPTAPGFSGQEHGEYVLNRVPELDASVASPEDQADERIIKLYTAPDQSLARIQRSKSRQKALELRSSAKAPAKSGLRHESISDVVSSQIRFSLSITNQPGQNDELSQLAETCVIGSQSCENRNVVEAHRLSRKTGLDTYSERHTRSESCAEVPISVKGSFPLGCSSENYKENASSQDAGARRTGSMPICDSEHAENHVNKSPKSAGPSADSCESFRDRRVEDADFLCKDEETNVYTGEITRSEISRKQQSYGCDSTKADSSSNDYLGIDITMMDSGDDPPPDFVVGSVVKVNLSNVRNEGCDTQESSLEDFRRHKEKDTSPSSTSIQHDAFIDEISHLEVPYGSAKVLGGILAPSSAGSDRQVNDSQELSGLVKSSAGLFRRVTRSQSCSYDNETYQPVTYNENPSFKGTKSISDHEEKSAEKLQNTSCGQSVSPCLGTHNMLHDDKNGKLVMASELVLLDLVDHSCRSSSNYSKQIRGFEFKETEEFNLKASTTRSGKKSLDNLLQKTSCSLHVPDVSLNKGICVENNQPSLGMSDVSSKEKEAHRDSFESDAQEKSDYGHSSADDPVAKSYGCLIKNVGTNPIAINETKQYLAHQSPMLSWPDSEVCSEHGDSSLENNHLGKLGTVLLHGKNSSLERRFTHARIESWPQVKRRKVEHQQAHFTTSLSFRVTKPHSFKKDSSITYPKTMEIDADTELMVQANKWEDGLHLQHSVLSSSNGDLQFTDADQSKPHSFKKDPGNTYPKTMEIDADTELMDHANKWEDGLHIQHSVLSSSNGDLQFTDVDQSMPEFEGFVVNAETDTGELDFAADGFDLGELELPRTTLERASILAQICRSASLDRLSSHFSSAFKFETENICKSVPDDGHLKLMEFGNMNPLNSDVGIHFQSRSSSSVDYKDSQDGMPYSVSLACSGERYGWNSRNHPSSPVGKLWDQLSSHSGSSGKGLSSNPELTCFPIEEDPSSSEDNKTMEEDAGDTQDEIDSSFANHRDKRHPLEDLTNMGKNSSMPVSAEEETSRADFMDFLSSKFSVTGTQDKALLGPNQTDGRKDQLFSSIGPNAFKKAKELVNNSTCKSMNNSINKPVVSNKTSLKGQDQKLSLKESRRNNIVSNVSSFIPLIKQKQAATSCAGKRDVKVKALEAAEAAKRLEEKKENHRKMRKEALKLERAKMEEKNLRHMELEKKRKEEERKQKDADIIAKKRLREEEERKEKRKKKMRLEARQQQREQEEKKRAERPEKGNQQTKDDQMNSKKEFNNESKRQQNRQTTRGEGMALQKTQINLTLSEVMMNYEECGTSGLSCEAGEVMHVVDKSPRKDLLVQNNRGKSYEISPYQCSDDEDEKDDELPTKKYIPSWASKSSVALVLPLQLELDPDVVFPSDRHCSIEKVLLPRKLQQKRVAA